MRQFCVYFNIICCILRGFKKNSSFVTVKSLREQLLIFKHFTNKAFYEKGNFVC